MQTLTWLGSLSAWPLLRNGSLSWNPSLGPAAESLTREIERADPAAFAAALQAEAQRRLAAFTDGVQRYRLSPPAERPPEPPAVWSRGSARLLDYGAAGDPVVLCVPSLINRAYILDLTAEHSLMHSLAAQGLRPLLLDWGSPDADERGFTLTDYVDGHLAAALDAATGIGGGPVAVVGYCMGGTLAVALAAHRPDDVRALALLATPWAFGAGHAAVLPFLAAARPGLEAIIEAAGVLPVDVLQALFLSLNPGLAGAKFRRFAALPDGSPAVRDFVALEDWLNDGVPLAGPVARECLFDWYLANTPGRGQWRIGGDAVDPAAFSGPALIVVPEGDYIVPPEAAEPLATLLSGAELRRVAAGHIGMVAGSNAKALLHEPLGAWLTGG
ncbi:MAG: alpha/beta fold hydrolase [Rhodospirillaceae bacterium]